MQVAPLAQLVVRAQVRAEYGRHRHPHLAVGAGVANHRADDVATRTASQRMDVAHRDGFLARPEPCLGDDALFDPPLQVGVHEAETQQARVQIEQRARLERLDRALPGPRRLERLPPFLLHRRARLPGNVLGRIVGFGSFHHGRSIREALRRCQTRRLKKQNHAERRAGLARPGPSRALPAAPIRAGGGDSGCV